LEVDNTDVQQVALLYVQYLVLLDLRGEERSGKWKAVSFLGRRYGVTSNRSI